MPVVFRRHLGANALRQQMPPTGPAANSAWFALVVHRAPDVHAALRHAAALPSQCTATCPYTHPPTGTCFPSGPTVFHPVPRHTSHCACVRGLFGRFAISLRYAATTSPGTGRNPRPSGLTAKPCAAMNARSKASGTVQCASVT